MCFHQKDVWNTNTSQQKDSYSTDSLCCAQDDKKGTWDNPEPFLISKIMKLNVSSRFKLAQSSHKLDEQ